MERTLIAQEQLIGTRFEKCVVERLIGRGGYGLTFLAFDGELQEHRVIKVSQDSGLDEASRRRHLKTFLEEGLILSRLKHPQIVTLRGQGDKHGHRYMILDYIQGFSLRAMLDLIGQRQVDLGCAWQDLLDPVTASALVLSALYPLEYAHRANVHLPDREIFGVAHRDISPGNLILGVKGNEKGRLVLIDFGTAKTALTENVTVDQNLVGTIPYMGKARLQKANSPEQKAQYQDFWRDFRETQHDIHAIGVLYYQLLTGRLPFYGETSPQIIVKILDPEVYSQCHLDIASAYPFASGILRKCIVYQDFSLPLSEQPYQYPDAGAMRPEMEEVFHGLSGGRSVNDVLIALGKKLAHPELLVPSEGGHMSRHGNTSSGALPQDRPRTSEMLRAMPYPVKKRTPWPYAVGAAGLLALAMGAAWWLGPRPSAHPEEIPGLSGSQAIASTQSTNVPAPVVPADPIKVPSVTLERLDPVSPRDRSEKRSVQRAKPTAPKSGPVALDETLAATPGQGAVDEAARLAAQAMSAAEDGEYGKEAFVQAQSMVRGEDPAAFERISALLVKHPESPDLRLLKSQLIVMRNPASPEARRDLVALQSVRPDFMHPSLFHEQVMYLLWQADAALFETQKTQASRINLLKSSMAYLAEFEPNPAYKVKVQAIKDRLPR